MSKLEIAGGHKGLEQYPHLKLNHASRAGLGRLTKRNSAEVRSEVGVCRVIERVQHVRLHLESFWRSVRPKLFPREKSRFHKPGARTGEELMLPRRIVRPDACGTSTRLKAAGLMYCVFPKLQHCLLIMFAGSIRSGRPPV